MSDHDIIPLGNRLTILKHNITANVYAINRWQVGGMHHAVNFTSGDFCYLPHDEITTEHYHVLDEVTVRGVRIASANAEA